MHEVRRLRKLKGLTQVELAERAGVSAYTVTEIETGNREPRGSTLRKLANALDAEVADFYPKGLPPQPKSGTAAASKALQEALAIAWRLLAQKGQSIVEQSIREGPSAQLSVNLKSYHADAARLSSIRQAVEVTEELAEAEDAYQEAESRIQALLQQDIEGSAEEKAQLRRFKRGRADGNAEEREPGFVRESS